ncbi:FAD-binding oxidoreductase [Pseudoponticoccus marisrubri]|uniref:Flavodoxin reductase n=1 Tax=Pseudoponticoccus marisrubri TaxID=1685382 RepID=A0A0W7WKW9_9RHOB|nr:FAD-binding oxidoreductase [Pseudoponticoccus marisrubri]KUF11159.1 flavodoxin reductase [Pseudoponticoccus marisrubri]
MTHQLTLHAIEPVTHDTHHLIFDKPKGLSFTPGQAVDLALDRDGWREAKRPFTFTSLPSEDQLHFVIKSYPDHDGVTEQIGQMRAGDTVLVDDPWGAIEDKGDGVFIAGGAGVTPFIAILRQKLRDKGTLKGNTLVFSNKSEKDIILRDHFEAMAGLCCIWTVTDEPDSTLARGQIDAQMLKDVVDPSRDVCYICGPDPMVEEMPRVLDGLGVPEGRIVTEEFD